MTTAPAKARTAAPTVAVGATLAFAAAAGAVAVRRMDGMDMGPATELGPVGAFAVAWISMMAAMMLPSAAPAVARRVRAGPAGGVPLFLGSYLAVWALAGVAVYAGYRPHGSLVAGVVVIAAGGYELTPLKRQFRRRCRDDRQSGVGFGICCVGSSAGLMLVLLALGVMSIAWTAVVAVLVLLQKLLPPRLALDVPLALAIVGLGCWVALAPGSVPAFMQPM
jgi:predicted metal-binding membrane protein